VAATAVTLAVVLVVLIAVCAKKGRKKNGHRCEWCGESFTTAESLQRHTEAEHTVGGRRGTKADYVQVKRSVLVNERVNPFSDPDSESESDGTLPRIPPAVSPYNPTAEAVYAASPPPSSPAAAASGADHSITLIPTYEEPVNANYPERKLKDSESILGGLKMSRETFKLGEKLGSGVAGVVYKAMLGPRPVAVKELIGDSKSASEEFLQEAIIMGSLSNPRVRRACGTVAHGVTACRPPCTAVPPQYSPSCSDTPTSLWSEQIVQILGVCVDEGKPMQIVTELMENGDLSGYLRKKRREGKNVLTVGIGLITQLQLDACDGLEFLESIGCVHRDVAARNVLLDSDLRGKITDFGLSRDLYRKVYYEMQSARQLPVRWLAVETLTMGKASSKSDVWSFGVMMWETMTLCKLPYEDVPGGRELVTYLDSGKRLPQPKRCPDTLFALMLACWTTDPADRPSFKELRPRLDGIAASARGGALLGTTKPTSAGAAAPAAPRLRHSTDKTTADAAPAPPESPLLPRNTTVWRKTGGVADGADAGSEIEHTPGPKRPWWELGRISRVQAEETMRAWGPQIGLFLVRESGDAGWVLSRCVHNEGGDVPLKFSHSKVVKNNDAYRILTKNAKLNNASFLSLEELVRNFQLTPFPDGTKLIITPPPLAVVDYIEIVEDGGVATAPVAAVGSPRRYVNVGSRAPSIQATYSNMGHEAHVFRQSSGIGIEDDTNAKIGQYVNIVTDV